MTNPTNDWQIIDQRELADQAAREYADYLQSDEYREQIKAYVATLPRMTLLHS